MKLTELDPAYITWSEKPTPAYITGGTGMLTVIGQVFTLASAQGLEIFCPKCKDHLVHIPFADRGLLDSQGTHSADGRPTRWHIVGGTCLDDLSLSPSIDCTPSNPNCWHGCITNGEVSVL
jgi:hypothetical protein